MVAIFNRELSPSQIRQWYDDPFGPFFMRDEAGVVFAVAAAGGVFPDAYFARSQIPVEPYEIVGY